MKKIEVDALTAQLCEVGQHLQELQEVVTNSDNERAIAAIDAADDALQAAIKLVISRNLIDSGFGVV